MKPSSQALSLTLHAAALLAVLLLPRTHFVPPPQPETNAQKLVWMPPPPLTAEHQAPSGGGSRMPQLATRGAVPQVIHRLFQPPTIQHQTPPKMILHSGVDIAVPRLDLPTLGDSTSLLAAQPPSAGPGQGGIGNRGRGPLGNGPGNDPRGGSALQKVLGATPPVLVSKVEPEYSDEARKVRLQGHVLLAIDIDDRGRVTNVRVINALGMGLDEKAIEAVSKWQFRPALKDGRAIAYPAAIEVRFSLL